ncbi:MAG: TetR/AcrR family transcriptional regulator [Anaerolineae bacterium]|nr:TetR/AcrR family transcriptional regulator [Anaerolineae bacterium]
MTQQRGQQTRQRLLEEAQLCFARQGYDLTGVAEICEHAGVSKGAFYHHFASKQALFMDLLTSWMDRLDAQFAAIQSESPTVSLGFQRMVDAMDAVFAQTSGQFPLFLEFLDQARRDPAVWEATIAPYQRYRRSFALMIAKGVREGSLRELDPDLASAMLVSLAVGVLLQSALDPDGVDWVRVIRMGVDLIEEKPE